MRTPLLFPAWKLTSRPRWPRCQPKVIGLREASTGPLHLPTIDAKWHHLWTDSKHWTALPSPKGRYFVLPMFPYPSGNLHIGHVRVYTISDVIARFRRMSGHIVLHPIGWDAFGLPAENAAIERGIDPAEWTLGNIAKMKEQIVGMGGCWDWDKELMTCDPAFYKDTQRIFLLLHKHGLAYQAEAEVNYDPVDMTVLANEQVDSNGFSWRSGAKVEKRLLKQWFFRITDYKEALLDDLAQLDNEGAWPQSVISMQRNWLGRSQGANIKFKLTSNSSGCVPPHVTTYTTRPDTLFGVQYLALALDHPLVVECAKGSSELRAFLSSASNLVSNSKAGFLLEDVAATNPLASIQDCLPHASIPIFAAPYVLSEYGSGAVMGVPAHDARDFAFWRENGADKGVTQVILPVAKYSNRPATPSEVFTEHGTLSEICGSFAGMPSQSGGEAIVAKLRESTGQAEPVDRWRLRDWLVSRQRYWGTPIPIVHCQSCGPVPVPEQQLPVTLPQLPKDKFGSTKGNPLEHATDWLKTTCPKCSGPACRETDTMDTFVDSSWYYLKFAQSAEKQQKGEPYMPVDVYVGGIEHAILHLLYARFIAKFLASTSFWPNSQPSDVAIEPFSTLISQGMVHGRTLSDPDTKRILKPDEVDLTYPQQATIKATGKTPLVTFEKMSKSKYNGVDPTECIRKYGADVTRAHLLFSAPVSDVLDWDEEKISGIQRWFGRVWQLVHEVQENHASNPERGFGSDAVFDFETDAQAAEVWKTVQTTIVSVTRSLSTMYTLNTVISDLMQLTNALVRFNTSSSQQNPLLLCQSTTILLRLMAPITSSFVEECWDILHSHNPPCRAFEAGYPEPDGSLERFAARVMKCAVQVNGKLKFVAEIETPPERCKGEELKEWVLRRVFESREAGEVMKRGKWTWKMESAKKVVVVRGGRTVNLVF